MKLVLDSNVALKWVLPESDDVKAIRIRDEFKQGIHELISPDIFPIEVAHSLARAERRGAIKHGEDSQKMVNQFEISNLEALYSGDSSPNTTPRLFIRRSIPGGMPTPSWAWVPDQAGAHHAVSAPMPTKTWACHPSPPVARFYAFDIRAVGWRSARSLVFCLFSFECLRDLGVLRGEYCLTGAVRCPDMTAAPRASFAR